MMKKSFFSNDALICVILDFLSGTSFLCAIWALVHNDGMLSTRFILLGILLWIWGV